MRFVRYVFPVRFRGLAGELDAAFFSESQPLEWHGVLVDAETAAKIERTPAFRKLGMRRWDDLTDAERDGEGSIDF